MATTLKLAGYLTTEAAITFSGTQQLNSLADNEYTDLSDEIMRGVPTPTEYSFITPADCGIEVFLIPTVDGTNYPTWTGNTTTDQVHNGPYFVGYIPFTGTTAAQAGVLLRIEAPNGKYKWAARNRGNVALAGSGNVLYWRPHSYQAA